MRKPVFCRCENKDADQLQYNAFVFLPRQYFPHDCLVSQFKISNLYPFSVAAKCAVFDLVRNPKDRFSHNKSSHHVQCIRFFASSWLSLTC